MTDGVATHSKLLVQVGWLMVDVSYALLHNYIIKELEKGVAIYPLDQPLD